jgi:hypothetical protein
MKKGRPKVNIPWEDKDIIYISLSYNQVKRLLLKFRHYRTDSIEGQITQNILRDFRKFLVKSLQNEKLPPDIMYSLKIQQKQTNDGG